MNLAYTLQSVSISPDQESGPAVLIRQIVNGLRSNGHKVSFLFLRGREVVEEQSGRIIPLGLSGGRPFKTIESGLRRLQSELRLPYLGLFESFRFYQGCRTELGGATLCHDYHTLFGLGGTLAARQLKLPLVLTVDADLLLERQLIGNPLIGLQGWLARQIAKFSFHLARKLICVSKAAAQHFIDQWGIDPAKIAVLPNGVDLQPFENSPMPADARRQLGLGEGPTIMFVGSFQPWHGLETLLTSFAMVARHFRNAKLVLVGDGPVKSGIEAKTVALGLSAQVHLTGSVPNRQVPLWLAAADVVVAPYGRLPYTLWFSPLKLYEYMAAGKAIVASDSGQIAEVIRPGHNGLLFEPDNVIQLAETISDLLSDPAGRAQLGQNAHQQAVEQHSWQQYTHRLEQIYAEVCNNS